VLLVWSVYIGEGAMFRTKKILLSILLTFLFTPALLQAQKIADVDLDGSGTVDFPDFSPVKRKTCPERCSLNLD
jgi:hypothetical protein